MTASFSESFDGLLLSCEIADGAVTAVSFGAGPVSDGASDADRALWERVRGQLCQYFTGERREFDLPIRYDGTAFQRLVWAELRKIPYGETRTYGQLARLIGRPRAARAVGQACHVNPICVIVPCHRVVGADGSLTGFGGGLEVKGRLLELERRYA